MCYNVQVSPQACEHAALAVLQEGRDRSRVARWCAPKRQRPYQSTAHPVRLLCAEDPAMLCAPPLAPSLVATARPSPPCSSQFARVSGHLGRRLGEGLPHDGHRGYDEARARPYHLRRAQPGEQRQPHLRRVRPVGRRRLGLLGGVPRAGRALLLARAPPPHRS